MTRTDDQPGAQPHTHVRDCLTRLIGVRTSLAAYVLRLLEAAAPKIRRLVEECVFQEAEMLKNLRGPHWASNFGADQQSKGVSNSRHGSSASLTIQRP